MIVADTGALVALIDADDRYHGYMRDLYERDPDRWVVPWAVLPEVDYLVASHVGDEAARVFMADVAEGIYAIDWGIPADLARAQDVNQRYRALRLGLVDAVVIAIAERRHSKVIATLDLRHFGAVEIRGRPKLLPRDAD
ncbi:MAG: PIN domain-containing protein [Gammaproteobacteria bacterium]|nr:PIN domain-containing protein [Gammaproteobacteria bacterium]